jgi:hypothetical protein
MCAAVAVYLVWGAEASAAALSASRQRIQRHAQRKRELQNAAKEAIASGIGVEIPSMDSTYNMPEDHTPNTHGRKSRTSPARKTAERAPVHGINVITQAVAC